MIQNAAAENHAQPPLVSVIITFYNQQVWAESVVQSVLRQTWQNLECILVDDGSTDQTLGNLRRIAAADNRCRIVAQANSGVSAARNAGFAASTGEFVQFLDGDDLLIADKLAVQLRHFSESQSLDVSCAGFEYLNAHSGQTARYPVEPIAQQPLQQMLFRWFDGACLPLHAALFRRRIWSDNRPPFRPEYRGRCEDWVFLVDVALTGAVFGQLSEVLCIYRMSDSGFTACPRSWNAASLVAASAIAKSLPEALAERFLSDYSQRTLDRYLELRKSDLLQASGNWRLGNRLTKPVFLLLRLLKRCHPWRSL
jgi:glycosyltransferase involved in cell wall biosynthesis